MSSELAVPNPAWEIVLVRPQGDEELVEQCYDLRMKVFHVEQGFPADTEIDDYDKTAFQFLLRSLPSREPMGVVRLNASPIYKLGRLAVLPPYRRQGHAERLVKALHDFVASTLKEGEEAVMWLNSQMQVVGWYEKQGYVQVGEIFDEEGAPHRRMEARITAKPASSAS